MPRKLKDTIEFSGQIPREKYRRFMDAVPVFGANTWFVNKAIDLFLEEVEHRPGIKLPLQYAIQRLIEELVAHNLKERNDHRLSTSPSAILERNRTTD